MLDKESLTENVTRNVTVHRFRSLIAHQATSETKLDEQILLKRLSQGDKRAFWQLWILHQDYLYSCCQTWMGGNQVEAEEALSRARQKSWEKMPFFADSITYPKAWLARLTHNICIDIHRERKKGAKGVENIENISEDEEIGGSSESPEAAMLRQETSQHIRRAINSLPAKLRDASILLWYEEMPYRDIAKKLALSENNVRKRIQLAREILQKQLHNYRLGLDTAEVAEPNSDEPTTSGCEMLRVEEYVQQPIDYKVTTTYLDSLLHTRYSSSSLLSWK